MEQLLLLDPVIKYAERPPFLRSMMNLGQSLPGSAITASTVPFLSALPRAQKGGCDASS